MGLSDYNLSGDQNRNIEHFASIVRLALADNVITEGEEKLLKRLAKRFHILKEKYNAIIENPKNYPIHTPQNYNERIEYLYDLVKMIYADGDVGKEEIIVLRRICAGIGFTLETIENAANTAIDLVLNETDIEDFKMAIKRVNKA